MQTLGKCNILQHLFLAKERHQICRRADDLGGNATVDVLKNWRHSCLLRIEVSGGVRNGIKVEAVDLKSFQVKCQKQDMLAL